MKSSYCNLMIDKNYRSVPVAMAGRARGAICAVLDFLLHFCVKTKVEIRENTFNPTSKNSPYPELTLSKAAQNTAGS